MEISPTRRRAAGANPSSQLSFWWKALRRRIVPGLENEHGLRVQHLRVLAGIARGHCSPGALVEAFGLPHSEVSRVLDIVSQKGLVRRELEPVDPRRVMLVLTPEGEAVVAGLNRSMRKLFREGLDYEPPSPWKRLGAVLDIDDELSDDFDALSDDF